MGDLQYCCSEVCTNPLSIAVRICLMLRRVSTGYGQPSSTLYDWTLSSSDSLDPNFKLPEDIRPRLEIEKFCDRVTRALYTNRRDPVGLTSDHERSTMIAFLSRDFEELEEQLKSQNDCKLPKFKWGYIECITNDIQVSPTCSSVLLTFICTFRHSLMSQPLKITVNASYLCMSRRQHSSKLS